VFPINAHKNAIINQSEVYLQSGHTVHFYPSLSPRPSFQFFKGSALVLRLEGGGGGEDGNGVKVKAILKFN